MASAFALLQADPTLMHLRSRVDSLLSSLARVVEQVAVDASSGDIYQICCPNESRCLLGRWEVKDKDCRSYHPRGDHDDVMKTV